MHRCLEFRHEVAFRFDKREKPRREDVEMLLQHHLEERIQAKTGRRVRHLAVEFDAERVVLKGTTSTYHVKQLAQHGVREVLPDICLENAITVETR